MSTSSRCCTFCYRNGHSVDQCNNDLLIQLARRIYNSYQIIIRDTLENEDPQIRFYNYCRRYFNSIELRSVSVRFLYGRSRWTKQKHIIHIIDNIDTLQFFTVPISHVINQPQQIQNEMHQFIENYLNSNPNQIEDITIISSTTQVYNYTLIPRNLENDFNAETNNQNYTTIQLDIICNNDKNNDSNNITCPICLEDNIQHSNKIQLNCNHEYCFDCISRVITNYIDQPKCSLCRANISKISVEDGCVDLLDKLNSLVNV